MWVIKPAKGAGECRMTGLSLARRGRQVSAGRRHKSKLPHRPTSRTTREPTNARKAGERACCCGQRKHERHGLPTSSPKSEGSDPIPRASIPQCALQPRTTSAAPNLPRGATMPCESKCRLLRHPGRKIGRRSPHGQLAAQAKHII